MRSHENQKAIRQSTKAIEIGSCKSQEHKKHTHSNFFSGGLSARTSKGNMGVECAT